MPTYRLGEIVNPDGGFGDIVTVSCLDDGWTGVAKILRGPFSDEDRARFQREVRLMMQLDHPNVVKVRASNLTVENPWYAMERAEMNLRQYYARVSPDREDMLRRFVEICRAVRHAHENGIIHRDLKPENVLIFDELLFGSFCVVSDFGLGKHIDHSTLSLTMTNAQMGTPAYMAPEQLDDFKNVDQTVDVYALGKILYEILTGEFPFLPRLVKVDQTFRHVVAKATDIEPRMRYQSVEAMLTAIEVATGAPDTFERPGELFARLVERLQQRPTVPDLSQLAALIAQRTNDETFLYDKLPSLPTPVIALLLSRAHHEWVQALEAYDRLVSGTVSFSYCDIVADFYERVYSVTTDRSVQLLILRRLPDLARSHNRWHVGEVFGRIVAGITDHDLLMAVRDILAGDADLATWMSSYLRNVPQVIRDVLPVDPDDAF